MNSGRPPIATAEASELVNAIAETLDVPPERYEAAERSYHSIGEWLNRRDSVFGSTHTTVYTQGSFALGTVIRPLNEDDDYDLDIACEIALSKRRMSQADLKDRLGGEIRAYAARYGCAPRGAGRRCWTLEYADGAQFHIDILPAVPDGYRQQHLVASTASSHPWAHLAIGITDTTHPLYEVRTEDWPISNPRAYREWFRSRIAPLFLARRQEMALRERKASVEAIPEYRVRTPLQTAIQVRKRHRDTQFSQDSSRKPASIILTTLAAYAYEGEMSAADAILGILARMDRFIDRSKRPTFIANPVELRENFADRWVVHPEKEEAFFEWMHAVRSDFAKASGLREVDGIVDALAPRMGRELVMAAANRYPAGRKILGAKPGERRLAARLRRLLDAPHKRPPLWPEFSGGTVRIRTATLERSGFRVREVQSDSDSLPKGCTVTFNAETDVSDPDAVYWQIGNTGDEAAAARDLRGGFVEDSIEAGQVGGLTRRESTKYTGSHTVECFVVKRGYCVARSGPFVVNIE
ncbi:MAG: nucleotidyltransferase [Deltaproteobacteria bacterium]|nr:nucleotidyltransferase [Deltaproteobacteria bacterium]